MIIPELLGSTAPNIFGHFLSWENPFKNGSFKEHVREGRLYLELISSGMRDVTHFPYFLMMFSVVA
jgi:hypothetical protein